MGYDLSLGPLALRRIPESHPGHHAANRSSRHHRIKNIEFSGRRTLLQQRGQPMVKEVAFLANAASDLGIEILLLPFVNNDVLLIVDDDTHHTINQQLKTFGRCTRLLFSALERLQRQANASFTDLEQQLTLVLKIRVDKRFGNIEALGNGINGRALIAVAVEQVACLFADAAALEVGNLLLKPSLDSLLTGCSVALLIAISPYNAISRILRTSAGSLMVRGLVRAQKSSMVYSAI